MKSLYFALALVACLGSSGCAVALVRTSAHMNSECTVYPSVKTDLVGMAFASEEKVWGWKGIIYAFCLADAIPSLAVDTVMLPYDATLAAFHKD